MQYHKEALIYLAGLLDGEGTISMSDKRIMKQKSRGIRTTSKIYRARVNFSTNVTVCNTDERLMSWLVDHFGGTISISKRQKTNWKQKMTWIMPTKEISTILAGVLPYLVLKKEQAELMIEARQTFDNNQKQLLTSDEVYNRRLEICSLIRLHNKRVLPPCCP